MPRKRTRRTTNQISQEESDDTDHNMPIITRKSTRKKQTPLGKIFKKHRSKSSENDYDADSEEDEKLDSIYKQANKRLHTASDIDSDSSDGCNQNNIQCNKRQTRSFISSKSKINFSSVNSDCSSESKEESTDERNKESVIKTSTNQNKENVTPPGSHSTPALLKLATRKLDDSLFGFDSLDPPLQFSPVYNKNKNNTEISSQSTMTFITSPNKRKFVKDDEGFFDLPIELPKKKQKKKRSAKKNFHLIEKDLENLRSQFAEVEMHELVIE